MAVLHDLACTGCQTLFGNMLVDPRKLPRCAKCKGPLVVVFDGWETVHSDCYSTPQWSDAAGRYVSSTREKDRIMREAGFTAAGDPVGGARRASNRSIKRSTFSYAGQKSRTTGSERFAHVPRLSEVPIRGIPRPPKPAASSRSAGAR